MRSFDYLRPESIEEAIELKARFGGRARFLAGGTDLLVRLKDDEIQPEYVIDLSFIGPLKEIKEADGKIVIGSLASYADIASSILIEKSGYILRQGALEIGAPQIQNAATIGGNIANASPAADGIPPLYALGSMIAMAGTDGRREVAVEDFFTGPGKTVLKDGELIVEVAFPKMLDQDRGFFRKIGQRKALAIAKASVAVRLRVAGKRIEEARVALGAVAPTVIRCPKTEAVLRGGEISAGLIGEAAKTASSESRAIGDVRSTPEYRDYVVGILFERGMRNIFSDMLPQA